jgi:hypothetical protein
MPENKPVKATPKKSAPAKKSAVKKPAVKKKASSVKKTATKAASQSANVNADPSIQSMIEEMSSQRQTRDKQISSLIEEVRDGFSTLSSRASKQDEAHQNEMTGLYQSLQTTFGQIKDDSVESEEHNKDIFKSLSDSMMHDHELTLKEINAQGKLQDKKIEYMTKMLEQRTRRNRLIAVPGIIIAIVSIVYMFYVVTVMETAMTDMSANMQLMQVDVSSMSGNMGNMSNDTAAINTNMEQLNGNMGHVSQDLNILTHNVAPAMKGMRDVMPWAP